MQFSDYEFEVFPVKVCPGNKEDWDSASYRLNFNKTHGYHCVPNTQFTSLVEFCYPRIERIVFQKGYCLKLASVGILNQVSCHKNFLSGCPSAYFFGNELYKYPMCLNINTTLRCFTADKECIVSRVGENMKKIQNYTNFRIDIDNQEKHNCNCSIVTDNRKDHKYLPGSTFAPYTQAPSDDTKVITLSTEADSNIEEYIPLSE